jgi:NDP-sugar pyrophosphorylase family protein
MNAMILAAGRGTRLGAIGRHRPKVLVDVGDQPLLARHLDYLERRGVERVVINAHHLAADIQAFVRAYDGPLEIVCVVEKQLLGTAGGVRNALQYLGPGPFLVLYGDVLVQESLDDMVDLHRKTGAVATLAVHASDSVDGKGIVEVDDAGRVKRFAEKPGRPSGAALINSGIYVIQQELISSITMGSAADFGEDVFPAALASGVPMFAHRLKRPVIDIGTVDGLALARAAVNSRSHPVEPGTTSS